jgi:hypothetical protein
MTVAGPTFFTETIAPDGGCDYKDPRAVLVCSRPFILSVLNEQAQLRLYLAGARYKYRVLPRTLSVREVN